MNKLLFNTLIILFLSSSAYATTTVTKTVKSSGGDYTSLSAWEAGQQGDLVSADQIQQAECHSFVDTTAVVISGWTTDATHYIKIYAAQSHGGKYSTSAYRLEWTGGSSPGSGGIIDIPSGYVKIDGIQIQANPTADIVVSAIHAGDGGGGLANIWVSNCIIAMATWPVDGWRFTAINCDAVNSATVTFAYIWNNLFYNMGYGGYHNKVGLFYDRRTVYLYNNTIDGVTGRYTNQTNGFQLGNAYGTYTATGYAKNNLFSNFASGSTGPLIGTWAAGSDYNATNLSDLGYTVTGSGNTHDRLSQTFTFVNEGAYDFHLAAGDAGAKGYGVDLSADANLPFSVDIDGNTRTAPWDIGADGVAAAAATGVTSVIKGNMTIKGNMVFK